MKRKQNWHSGMDWADLLAWLILVILVCFLAAPFAHYLVSH